MNVLLRNRCLEPEYFLSIKYMIHSLEHQFEEQVLQIAEINPYLAVEICFGAEKNPTLELCLLNVLTSLGNNLPIAVLVSKALGLNRLNSDGYEEVARYICYSAKDRIKLDTVDSYWIDLFISMLRQRGLTYLLPSFTKLVGRGRIRDMVSYEDKDILSWFKCGYWKHIENYVESLGLYGSMKELFLSDRNNLLELYEDFSLEYMATCKRAIRKLTQIYLYNYGLDDIFEETVNKYRRKCPFIIEIKSAYQAYIQNGSKEMLLPSYNLEYWDEESNGIPQPVKFYERKSVWLKCKCGYRWMINRGDDKFKRCECCTTKVLKQIQRVSLEERGREIIRLVWPNVKNVEYDKSCYIKANDEAVLNQIFHAVGMFCLRYDYDMRFKMRFGYTKSNQLASILLENEVPQKLYYYGKGGGIIGEGIM